MKDVRILIQMSRKYIPNGPINNNLALAKIIALCRTGDKPLYEPIMVSFFDAYMHHSASIN